MKPAKLQGLRRQKASTVPTDKVKQIVSMHHQGFSNLEISRTTQIVYNTVKTVIRREIYNDKARSAESIDLHEQFARERLHLTAKEVAEAHGMSPRYVRHVTKDHPRKDKFKRARATTGIEKAKPDKLVRKKPVTEIGHDTVYKGFAKLKPNEKVYETREHRPKRAVPIRDIKNTIIFVDQDDPRSNDQIRTEYLARREELIKQLA